MIRLLIQNTYHFRYLFIVFQFTMLFLFSNYCYSQNDKCNLKGFGLLKGEKIDTSFLDNSPSKKVVMDKNGLVLTKIPQYGYNEEVYFEIDGLNLDDEDQFIITYKYLEEIDQPYLLQTFDAYAIIDTLDNGNVYFRIPSFGEQFKKKDPFVSPSKYVKSKNKEAFLIYNLLKTKRTVGQECITDLENKIAAQEIIVKPKKDKVDSLELEIKKIKTAFENNDSEVKKITQDQISNDREIIIDDDKLKVLAIEIELVKKQLKFYQENIFLTNASQNLKKLFPQLVQLKSDSINTATHKRYLNEQKKNLETDLKVRKTKLDELIKKDRSYIQKNNEKKTADDDFRPEGNKLDSLIGVIESYNTTESPIKILKIGGIVKGNYSKTIAYELGYRKTEKLGNEGPHDLLDIKRMGNIPILTERDHLYVSVINRIGFKKGKKQEYPLEGHNYNIYFSYTETDSAAYLPTAIRPIDKISGVDELKIHGGQEKADDQKRESYTIAMNEIVYQDLLLHLGQNFRRNRLLNISIHADNYVRNYGSEPEKDRFKIERKLLLRERYPQIRGLYRFSITTGFVTSFLDNVSYKKIRNTNSPDASPTYFIESSIEDNELKVKPIIGLTLNWKPVDILSKTKWTEWIPNPFIGFDFTKPTEDIFIGGSSEFIRNVQIIYGVNFSKVERLSDNQNLTIPDGINTTKKFDTGLFIGVSFNFNLVPQMYQQFFRNP